MARSSQSTDTGLLLIRLMVGLVFTYHGCQKVLGLFGGPGIDGFAGHLTNLGVPWPTLSAWLAGLTELLGGLAVATGIGFRAATLLLAFVMVVACSTAHSGFGGPRGMEYPMTLGVVVVALFLLGPGRLSIRMASERG